MADYFAIHQVARETGMSVHTLRYYERIGLIHSVPRGPDGHRRYTRHDIDWLNFLVRLRETGMSIGEMSHYASLRRQGIKTHPERKQMLVEHLSKIHSHILRLQELAGYVAEKISHYGNAAQEPTGADNRETGKNSE